MLKRRFRDKRILAVVCLCIVMFVSGSALSRLAVNAFNGIFKEKKIRNRISGLIKRPSSMMESQPKEKNSVGITSSEERFECFNSFVIHLEDNHKKDRILVCDVVLGLNRGMKLARNRVELRKIIYRSLKKLSNLPGTKWQLKEEIKVELNSSMEGEIIKGVYFTRYILL